MALFNVISHSGFCERYQQVDERGVVRLGGKRRIVAGHDQQGVRKRVAREFQEPGKSFTEHALDRAIDRGDVRSVRIERFLELDVVGAPEEEGQADVQAGVSRKVADLGRDGRKRGWILSEEPGGGRLVGPDQERAHLRVGVKERPKGQGEAGAIAGRCRCRRAGRKQHLYLLGSLGRRRDLRARAREAALGFGRMRHVVHAGQHVGCPAQTRSDGGRREVRKRVGPTDALSPHD